MLSLLPIPFLYWVIGSDIHIDGHFHMCSQLEPTDAQRIHHSFSWSLASDQIDYHWETFDNIDFFTKTPYFGLVPTEEIESAWNDLLPGIEFVTRTILAPANTYNQSIQLQFQPHVCKTLINLPSRRSLLGSSTQRAGLHPWPARSLCPIGLSELSPPMELQSSTRFYSSCILPRRQASHMGTDSSMPRAPSAGCHVLG